MSHVTTHVLDAATGTPATGVAVALTAASGAAIAIGVTDGDGRVPELGPDELPAGDYRLTVETGAWFASQQRASFYPRVTIDFTIAEGGGHYHVPVLLSPFAYSTYRGS